MKVFARNPRERKVLSAKHIAVVGLGSLGGAIAEIAVRAGMDKITLVDPDRLAEENLARHMLDSNELGRFKVLGMARRLLAVNPDLQVTALWQKFEGLPQRPDSVVAASDSYQCSSRVNAYALHENVPAIFASVWGPAKVAEAFYMVPGKTACYECFASFRKDELEIPDDPRRYTDQDFDITKVAGQEGLWCNVLMAAGMQFQIVLGLIGLLDCIDYEHPLWLMNISDYASGLQPLAVTFGKVKKGCPVCDDSMLSQLEGCALDVSSFRPDGVFPSRHSGNDLVL